MTRLIDCYNLAVLLIEEIIMVVRPTSTGLQNDCDYEELFRIDSGRRRCDRDLAEHPDPRDPDYPGEEEE